MDDIGWCLWQCKIYSLYIQENVLCWIIRSSQKSMADNMTSDKQVDVTGFVASDKQLEVTGSVASDKQVEVTGSGASDKQLEVTGSVASDKQVEVKMKWNESGFRPPLCTYRLNWARRTSWGWWDDWDDTFLQTQDSKFVPWRSEAEHATSRSRRLPTILISHVDGEETFLFLSNRRDREPNPELWRERQRC